MNIQFYGAARTVTGAQFVITANGKRVLLECGLFQGRRADAYERNHNFPFDPKSINSVLLTHAHIDHSGNLPNLVKNGYSGSIYATPATIDLCKIMLRDSAYLQEKDIEWVNKIRQKHHEEIIEALYTMRDVEAAIELFVPIEFDHPFTIGPGMEAVFRDAGHILGSAGIHVDVTENGVTRRIGFSGDIGRPNLPLTRDPNILRDLDLLVMESTYGNRHHGSYDDVEDELAQTVREVASSGGKLIIPSFAVGRTQHLVYVLHKLFDQDRIPDMPIYVDSPLACNATNVFRAYPHLLDRETQRTFLADSEDPFGFKRLTYIHDASESKKLNYLNYPHIIISGSGMAEGGRILHHLKNNIDNQKNLILFVGYAAKHTLARKIMDGDKVVKIFGEGHSVRAKIKIMDAFSAHADRRNLLDYVDINSPKRLKHIFLVHGEPDQALPLRDGIRSKGFENVYYPESTQTFILDKDGGRFQ